MSFPRYPKYKDSGVEWLGKVPEHWTVTAIKWLSPVLRGASPRPIDDQRYFDEDGEYAWVRIADASAAKGILTETTQRLSALGSSLSVRLMPGQLFISIAGTVGKPCIAGMKCCIHDGFVYFPKLRVDPMWLFRLFEQGECYGGLGKFGTQLNLNTDTIGSIKIGLPPEQERQDILGFIDSETAKIDALVEEQKRLIELLKEKRQAVISQAVTKGLDPNVPMKDSGVEWLGEVPEHWQVAAVNYRYEVLLGKMLDEKQISGDHLAPYLRNVDVQWDQINTDDLPQMDFTGEDLERYRLAEGDLLVCEGGEVGRAAIWDGELNECYYQKALHRLRGRDATRDHARFMFYLLRMATALGVFEATGGKSTISHLTAESLRRYRFAFPSADEQARIAALLDNLTKKLDALIAESGAAMNLLLERRAALISAAVTGKVDVRGLVPQPETEAA